MSRTLTLDIKVERDSASPELARLGTALTDRSGLHAAILPELDRLSRRWISAQAKERHNTARDLGATPTGALERAAQQISGRSDSAAATVEFTSPLMARAFRTVTIRPKAGKKFLTLPISGQAYGVRARELERSIGKLTALFGSNEQSGVLVHKEKGRKQGTAHYLLVRQTVQKQDATLLPPDEGYLDAARQGALTFLGMPQS